MSVSPKNMVRLSKTTQDMPWARNIKKYSINLMWINKSLMEDQTYINHSKTTNELKEQLLEPALKWAKANLQATITIWYDGLYTTQEAVKRTQDVLHSLQTQELSNTAILLKDIRSIPVVKDNPDVFSDSLPVYFRIDLLKVIIIVDAIEREFNDAAIFSDLEVGDCRPNKDRMNKDELFSAIPFTEDSARLVTAGLILNNDSGYNENQFIQLYNNPVMIFAIKHAVINVNLKRAITALNFKHKEDWMLEDSIRALSRCVFSSTQEDVFAYYQAITNPNYELLVRADIVEKGSEQDTWLPYNPDEHGYSPFGLYCFGRCGAVIFDKNDKTIKPKTVFKLPDVGSCHDAAREVNVRRGGDHYSVFTTIPPKRPAISCDGLYRCYLMETGWVLRKPLISEKNSFIDSLVVDPYTIFEHYAKLLNSIFLIGNPITLVLEYLNIPETILDWLNKQKKLNTEKLHTPVASTTVMTEINAKTTGNNPPLIFSSPPAHTAFTTTSTCLTAKRANI